MMMALIGDLVSAKHLRSSNPKLNLSMTNTPSFTLTLPIDLNLLYCFQDLKKVCAILIWILIIYLFIEYARK